MIKFYYKIYFCIILTFTFRLDSSNEHDMLRKLEIADNFKNWLQNTPRVVWRDTPRVFFFQ